MASFHCDYADLSTLSATKILGTLAKQLLEDIDIPPSVEQDPCFSQGNQSLSVQEVSRVLGAIVSLYSTIYLVVDGLDECPKEEEHDVLNSLRVYCAQGLTSVKIFVSSREPAESFDNNMVSHTIFIRKHDNSSDIYGYIRESISSLRQARRLAVQDESLVDEIINTLSEKAHGM